MESASDNLPPIYTIGYGGRDIETFLKVLKEHDIEYLLDVRSWPKSNREDYSQEQLRRTLKKRGIRYAFFGETLGGRPEDSDCYTNGHVDYDACRSKNWFREGIERLRTAQKKECKVALMCSEQRPEECHRSKMIGVGLENADIDVKHIDENGDLCTQQEALKRITKNQSSLFDDDPETGLHSRNSYD